MRKETVWITVTHTNGLKAGTTDQWEVSERVEFVNQLKKRHYQYASIIANYSNETIFKGRAIGVDNYVEFENYVRSKHPNQMKQLDDAYRPIDLKSGLSDTSSVSFDKDGNLVAEAITVSD